MKEQKSKITQKKSMWGNQQGFIQFTPNHVVWAIREIQHKICKIRKICIEYEHNSKEIRKVLKINSKFITW